jgi:arylsulfatase A-like enzyme
MALSRGLNPGVRTFGEDLASAGYTLAFSGKWHVSVEESPRDRGWEELFVSGAAAEHHGMRWEDLRRMAEQPDPTERKPGHILRPGYGTDLLYGPGEPNGHDETAVARAVEALPRLAASGEPWALFVGAIQPHAPYMALEKYLQMYDLADVPLPSSYADTLEDKPRYYKKLRHKAFDQLSPEEVRDAIRHFWAVCSYLDDLFGQLLAALEATGQADNTVVVYTSDHGDYLGDHGLFHKGVPAFRGAYQVPAVVRWPDGIAQPGRRVEELVSLADFAPTFAELAGLTPDPDLTGRSLGRFLTASYPPAPLPRREGGTATAAYPPAPLPRREGGTAIPTATASYPPAPLPCREGGTATPTATAAYPPAPLPCREGGTATPTATAAYPPAPLPCREGGTATPTATAAYPPAPLPRREGGTATPMATTTTTACGLPGEGGAVGDWRDAMYAQVNGVEHYFTQRAVWTREWKYVYNGFDNDELYDLRADPDEMVNLDGDPAYDEVKRELVQRMWQFAYEQHDPLGPDGGYITVGLAPWGPAEAFRKPADR